MDPLAGSTWSTPATVAGFARSLPNPVLMQFAAGERERTSGARLLDLGCGAGRNAIPLAALGWNVVGLDLSWPMLAAAADLARGQHQGGRVDFVLAPMDRLPARDGCFDVLVAHGIWNLAPSARMFRAALAEAARVARPATALFVFTFSRNTLPPDAQPVTGEPFVFTQFSGEPQCFLTEQELGAELGAVGFVPEPGWPLKEYNRQPPGALGRSGAPVIYEGVFRMRRPVHDGSGPGPRRDDIAGLVVE